LGYSWVKLAVVHLLSQKGVSTIGIKASLIEWERAGGTDRHGSGLRSAEYVSDYLKRLSAAAPWVLGYGVESAGDVFGFGSTGSVQLGISECVGMGWRLQDLDGASYAPLVRAGFRASGEGVQPGSTKGGDAPGTLVD